MPDINRIMRANPRPCTYGAPMGARSYHDGNARLYLQRVQFVDGDYAPDGTYWGGGRGALPLWCAFHDEARIYVRANTRRAAIAAIREDFPEAIFHRE